MILENSRRTRKYGDEIDSDDEGTLFVGNVRLLSLTPAIESLFIASASVR